MKRSQLFNPKKLANNLDAKHVLEVSVQES